MSLAVCATPIGNLDDVTPRVLAELTAADVVLCEDTRRTRILLARHEIKARSLISLHEHNEARRETEVIERLRAGARIALVSDAGLPGISDPGVRLVDAAHNAGVEVTVLPGASAVTTALVASGFGAERFQYVGFLPRGKAALEGFWTELRDWPHVAVAFESPQRLGASLASAAGALPDRRVAVCRELTKRFEEISRGTVAELAGHFSGPVKGEVTLVFAAAPVERSPGARDEAAAAVSELVAAGVPRRQAAEIVAGLTGESKNALYRASL